ncbi:hypothetical protein [Primorskyibacter sp. S87]|uniref:hypothetical protein n=1 Tax=Primorskyibacter sp. S87 TaxID=3415126 RepID=UPI003C799155
MAFRKALIVGTTLAVVAPVAFAQDTPPTPQPTVLNREFCRQPENAEIPECIELLENADNLLPLVGAGAGLLGLAALAGGGGSTTSTSTTTTTGGGS